jgi:LysM repeat protein
MTRIARTLCFPVAALVGVVGLASPGRAVLSAAPAVAELLPKVVSEPALAADAAWWSQRRHTPKPPKAKPPKPYVLRLRTTVVPGDSLTLLARRYGVTVDALRKVNYLSRTSVLRPGQVLRVPDLLLPTKLVAKLPAAIRQRPDRLRLVPLFQAASRETGVPVDLLMAVAYRESNWNTNARSVTGAMGVGQLMPETVQFVSFRLLGLPKLLDPWEAADNIRMSARTLQQLIHLTKGRIWLALTAYYQGFGSVTRQGVQPVGRAYADSIQTLRAKFQG